MAWLVGTFRPGTSEPLSQRYLQGCPPYHQTHRFHLQALQIISQVSIIAPWDVGAKTEDRSVGLHGQWAL